MNKQHLKLYLLLILPLLAIICAMLWSGHHVSSAPLKDAGDTSMIQSLAASLHHPLVMLLLQIIVILLTARVVGYLFKLIGQQEVIGEITAGILLGPSLLGWVAPDVFGFVFPPASLPNLQLLSQVGLVLFMFVIGMELDIALLKNRGSEALLVSHVSIVFPFALGVGFAFASYASLAPAGVPFIAYALFMGIAMSITAFPVLARILKERKMTRTPVGSMAIICAAINDVTGWCMLVAVTTIAKSGDASAALVTLALTTVYVLLMFFPVRYALRKFSERSFGGGHLQSPFVAAVFLTLLGSAFVAEWIGIHALFGAFLAGVVMPTNVSLRKLFTERVEDVSVSLLLPLFFVFTGLRTQIGLLNNSSLWWIAVVVIALAVIGKLFGTAIAAKLAGQSWKDSLSTGALMNTRGLMELVVLNIGYDMGILTQEVFTILVFMALITTFMTAPLLNLIGRMK
jgi:Kef-type K+ transport system membrane component KefB